MKKLPLGRKIQRTSFDTCKAFSYIGRPEERRMLHRVRPKVAGVTADWGQMGWEKE